MHEQNPFRKDYDFKKLVHSHPQLKEFIFINPYQKSTINFADPKAVKSLNTALLKLQYKIEWDLPDKNLCPPIPGRLDYLLHVSELVRKNDIHLLDIGTGASLIYPILGTCHFNWKCTASEITESSLYNAKQIIRKNSRLESIELRKQDQKAFILNKIIRPTDFFDVLICNPPFYRNSKEANRQAYRKNRNLKIKEIESRNFSGIADELWCPGGEKQFIETLVKEGAKFKNQIEWFTALISNEEHLKAIQKAIQNTKPKTLKIVQMGQGNKTSRFAAWSYLK